MLSDFSPSLPEALGFSYPHIKVSLFISSKYENFYFLTIWVVSEHKPSEDISESETKRVRTCLRHG